MRKKSGLETLLEALQSSGVDVGEFGGPNAQNRGNSNDSDSSTANHDAGGRAGAGWPGKNSWRDKVGNDGNEGTGGVNLDFTFMDAFMPKAKKSLVLLAIVALLVVAFLYWWFHPAISINSVDTWWFVIIVFCIPAFAFFGYRRQAYTRGTNRIEPSPSKAGTFKMLSFIPIAVVVCFVLGGILSNAIIPGNAEKYANVLKTDTLNFAEDIKEADYSQIPVIDRNSAILLGDKQLGSIPEYVSQFEISELYSQINYKNEPVRVSPLAYADIFKWFINRDGGLPAYSLVNMTSQNAEIVRLGDNPIYYSPSEPLERNIERHVQLKYPTYIFDEMSFEIDEDGRAWWICPVRTFTIGLFGGYTIDRVILCDATTGATQEMSVGEVPQWVDRVFPAELLLQQYNWYGAYHNGWLNAFLGQEGVVRTTPGTEDALGYNYIAKDDDVWVYTGVTSATSDSSIVGFVLVNQRTAESHFYSVSGATEASAMSSAEGQVQNLRYTATFPLLLNVAEQPTYFMALKDAEGLVKKFAMIDIQRYQNVAVGDTVAETQTAYEQLLATNGVLDSEIIGKDVAPIEGKIETMAQAVIGGNSHFYITLAGDKHLYDFKLPGLLDIMRYKVGDTIKFTCLNIEKSAEVYSIIMPDGEVVTDSGENNEDAAKVDASAQA